MAEFALIIVGANLCVSPLLHRLLFAGEHIGSPLRLTSHKELPLASRESDAVRGSKRQRFFAALRMTGIFVGCDDLGTPAPAVYRLSIIC